MPYYHLYIRFINRKGKRRRVLHFGVSRAEIEERIAAPYMENKSFMIDGEVVHPSNTDEIEIFRSDEWEGRKLILPNGNNAMDEKNMEYIVKCLCEGRVKRTFPCTPEFITSPPKEETIKTVVKQVSKRQKVFIVHGRDEEQALRLQKYLTRTLKVDAEMFEDFKEKSGSNTIIEQLEYIKDNVGYAIVIVTPDDLGCLRENIDKCRTNMLVGKTRITVKSVCEMLDNLHRRARQNVVFEHGLFIGALGRDRVCCLLQKDVKEKPSDIDGILYVSFNKSVKDTFTEIAQKLKKAGSVKT